jgi:hypothetical protein
MERGFSMSDNTKYEVNRRYPFEGGSCPVDGEAVVTVWSDGEAVISDRASWFCWVYGDITHFMVLEYPPEKHVRWVNMYGNRSSVFHKTREDADLCATKSRTECVKVEYMDGEGL